MPATLQSRLPQIAASLRPKVARAVKAGAQLIAEDAGERVARGPDPHHISEDIHVQRTGPAEYAVVAGREDTFYGHILEFGSAKMAPRPFLVPAADDNLRECELLVEGVLRTL
jgi:HK97 gp10 family phage protein